MEPDAPLTADGCKQLIAGSCGLASPAPTVGAEVEWLVIDEADVTSRPSVEELQTLLEGIDLPGGSRITYEPGGQLELSGPPACTPDEATIPIAADADRIARRLASVGWRLEANACDRQRRPHRVNGLPRYGEMEQWFSEGGWSTGPEMMCNTAAVQVNLGCGIDPALTWRRSNRMAAPLAAAFADSSSDGWASSRLRAWAGLDPSRTRSALISGDPIEDWTAYALAAKAMLRQAGDRVERLPFHASFSDWMDGQASAAPPPTRADFDLHLSTLFPPVRLKAWMEMRVFDMPPGGDWPVPVAVAAALLTGPEVQDETTLLDATDGYDWAEAARLGMADETLRHTARALVDAAIARLEEDRSALAKQVSIWSKRLA